MTAQKDKLNKAGILSAKDRSHLAKEVAALIRGGETPELAAEEIIDCVDNALATADRIRRREAQAKGISEAREKGVRMGRRPVSPPPYFPEVVRQYNAREISLDTAAELCGVGKSTFYRLKKQAEEKQKF